MTNVFVLVSDQSFSSNSNLLTNTISPLPVNNNKPLTSNIDSTLAYWQCANGSCLPSTTVTPYTTQAACTSALVAPPYTGGQCVGIEYVVEFDYIVHSPSYPDQKWASRLNSADIPVGYGALNPMRINGAVVSVMKNATTNIIEARNSTGQLVTEASSIGSIANGYSVDLTVRGTKRSDALADTCGNLPSTCPV